VEVLKLDVALALDPVQGRQREESQEAAEAVDGVGNPLEGVVVRAVPASSEPPSRQRESLWPVLFLAAEF
jgi:hypothetical protein